MSLIDLTREDIVEYTDKFWQFYTNPLFAVDFATFIIATIQTNLAVGTLLRYLPERPDLKAVIQELLEFRAVGLYLLSERGRGLDAYNIETTATKVDGGYILKSAGEQAMKSVILSLWSELADSVKVYASYDAQWHEKDRCCSGKVGHRWHIPRLAILRGAYL